MENLPKKALGRGLGALIPRREIPKPQEEQQQQGERVLSLEIDKILPNRFQPREKFDPQSLNELISSIKEKGIVQPIIVRPKDDAFELIAGERRLQALKTLGINSVPAIVKEVDDAEALQISLIENIQRDQLSSIEEARAFKKLIDEFEFTQEKIADAVGKDITSVSNTLRLLNLPAQIQDCIADRKISFGHAKAILSLDRAVDQLALCEKIMREALSVRMAEVLAKRPKLRRAKIKLTEKDSDTISVEEKLQHALGTKVKIIKGRKRGKIIIEYYSSEELERILRLLGLE